jgi:hypothetical protein
LSVMACGPPVTRPMPRNAGRQILNFTGEVVIVQKSIGKVWLYVGFLPLVADFHWTVGIHGSMDGSLVR